MHLFLAPHFDDAVLSCGGTIHQLCAAGERVIVLTVMGGGPGPGRTPDTPLVRELHSRWNQSDDEAVNVRVQEDQEAVGGLGAESQRLLVWTECIYRVSRGGQPLYPTRDAIFSDIAQEDAAAQWVPMIVLPLVDQAHYLYAPMGVGNHVDHRIVRDWAIELKNQNSWLALKFYEEYPYNQDKTALKQVMPFFLDHRPPVKLQPETVFLTEDDVNAKLQAIRRYESQISSFWEGGEAMETATRKALMQAGDSQPGERYWAFMGR